MLNASPPAAVAAGNVETSSRVADLVFAALAEVADGPAQGQGTMNNLTLGARDGEVTYYETIGGGQGACRGRAGPSAVHVAMSNTLNTPVEALEGELPVRIRELVDPARQRRRRRDARRRRHRARIEALAPLRFSLITERRSEGPRGREGGGDGAAGRNIAQRRPLPAKCEGDLEPGDVLSIETPGGGGFGTGAAEGGATDARLCARRHLFAVQPGLL